MTAAAANDAPLLWPRDKAATAADLHLALQRQMDKAANASAKKRQRKRIKRRILATTPPTDLLHRALLINTALIPIYNHIFMALPTQEDYMNDNKDFTVDDVNFEGLGQFVDELHKV